MSGVGVNRDSLVMSGVVKNFVPHAAPSVALGFVWCNFCQIHSTLKVTPAIEA